MTIRYTRLWLPAAVAAAVAGQGLAQAQTTDIELEASQAQQEQAGEAAVQADQQKPDTAQAAPQRDQATIQADREKLTQEARGMSAQAPKAFHPATQLIGTELQNAKGEELGEVEEVVLDQSNNRVAYVVLSFGGWADIGDKLFAVPFDAVKWGQANQPSVLNVDKQRMKDAPGFDQNNWPDMADPQWSAEIDTFWEQDVRQNSSLEAQPRRGGGEMRWISQLSRLIGRDVDSSRGHLGEVEDIYIDDQGRLGFAAISFGGTLNIGDETALVPYNALNPRLGEDDFLLNATEADLKAAVIQNQLEPGLDEQRMTKVNEQFKTKPYWQGQANEQQDQMRQQIAMQRARQQQSQRAMTNKSWEETSEYNKQFKAGETKTYEGTVISVGQFEPGSDAAPGLRLRVRTPDNQNVTIHAGPRQWAQQQEVSFNPGDKVTIQGAQAQIDGRMAVLASQIKVKEQTLNLRDPQGKPQWKLEAQQRGVQQAAPERPEQRVTGEEKKLELDGDQLKREREQDRKRLEELNRSSGATEDKVDQPAAGAEEAEEAPAMD